MTARRVDPVSDGLTVGAPKWLNDWIDWCAEIVKVALDSGQPVPSQRRLEAEWPRFVRVQGLGGT